MSLKNLLRTGLALVEDDPYGQLRFSGEPLPPIAALRAAGVPLAWLTHSIAMVPTLIVVGIGIGILLLVEDGLIKLDFGEIAAGFDRITAAIAGLLGVDTSPASSIGTNIVDGMVGGILSGASGVVSAIQTVAGDAITAAIACSTSPKPACGSSVASFM